MSLFPVRMKKSQSKMKKLECSQHFPHFFSDAQGQLNPQCIVGLIRLNFEISLDCMVPLFICKNEEDSI